MHNQYADQCNMYENLTTWHLNDFLNALMDTLGNGFCRYDPLCHGLATLGLLMKPDNRKMCTVAIQASGHHGDGTVFRLDNWPHNHHLLTSFSVVLLNPQILLHICTKSAINFVNEICTS